MPQPAIRQQILEDLDALSTDLQRRVAETVHALAVSHLDGAAPDDILRFAIDHPLGHRSEETRDRAAAAGDRQRPLGGREEDLQSPGEGRVASDPEAILGEIRSLLADGQVLKARRLAAEAASRFPGHAELQSAERVLNEGEATIGAGGPEPRTDEQFEWLRHPPEWARGKWVALLGPRAVAAAETLGELVESLKSMSLPQQPLVHRVD